jgi:AraC-like DNA-binding protein
MDAGSIAWLPAGETVWQTLTGPTCWGSFSLPVEDWSDLAGAVAGCDITPRTKEFRVSPSHKALAALRRLQLAALHLAETTPELIANPEVARGLEQSLIDAIIECLRRPPAQGSSVARRHHALIMSRFREALEKRVGEAIYIAELCTEIGVAARTLRQCCYEYIGISPKRYLLLRRLHLARRALRAEAATSVTDVATRFGFWELGRFAVAYKALFGEAPSQTLRGRARAIAE